VIFGGTKATTSILDGSQGILKNSQIINHGMAVGVPFVASPPTITTLVFTNCTDSFYFDWVMRASSPVMTGECFPENIHDDSDGDYDFIYDGPVDSEYDSLFGPQQSTTEYDASVQLATTQ
jgi:hypothetical protein